MTEHTGTPAPVMSLPVVVGIDFSENAARAAKWAAREAADRGLALHLVYAMDLPVAWGELVKPAGYVAAHRLAGEMLLVKIGDTLLKSVREDYPEVKASTYVMGGNVVPILVGAALGARLVVVGAHRHLGLLSMGAGYVVQGLLAHSPTPVAVVPVT